MRFGVKFIVTMLLFLFLMNDVYALTGEDLAGVLQSVQSNLPPVFRMLVATTFVLGIWFMTDAIFRLKKYGQARTMMSTNASMAKPIILFLIGLGLLYFPTLIDVSIQTVWNYGSSSVLRYPDQPTMWQAFVNPIIDLIRVFGLLAFIRGMVILTRLAHESPQPGSLGKGLMHITGGIMAINIVGTIDIIKGTFGFA
jgi:intracellular multiplication protein IcmC